MNRRRADLVVGALVVAVLVVGGALSWDAYRQREALGEMGSMMESVHGTDPIWYVLGTLLVASLVGGLYLALREDLTPRDQADRAADSPTETAVDSEPAPDPATHPPARVLDLLPEDERRVLEPVLSSPGITQIELRDRSDFSKSKVSQTVTSLEKRGLLYRERQGRTFRIYPGEDLASDRGG